MKTQVMGDGGALIIQDEAADARARALRYLGFKASNNSGLTVASTGASRWWEFDLETTSGRFISNDISASIGRVQLRKLPVFLRRRKQIWEFYQTALADISQLIRPPEPLPYTTSSYYLYWIRVPKHRDALADFLRENGIYKTFRYYPLHRVPYFGDRSNLPIADNVSETALTLPMHQNLSDRDLEQIVDSINAFFDKR